MNELLLSLLVRIPRDKSLDDVPAPDEDPLARLKLATRWLRRRRRFLCD